MVLLPLLSSGFFGSPGSWPSVKSTTTGSSPPVKEGPAGHWKAMSVRKIGKTAP
jgi:hypothetical protein